MTAPARRPGGTGPGKRVDTYSLAHQPPTAEQVTAARRTVAHHARSTAEAAELLAMLGLDEAQLADRCPVCREHVHPEGEKPKTPSSRPIHLDGKCRPCHAATTRNPYQ